MSDSGFNPLAQAPAVTYPLSRATLLTGLLVVVLCLSLCVDLAWLVMDSAGGWRPWVGLLATVATAGLCWWQGPFTRSGRLSWDGVDWCWEGGVVPQRGSIHLTLDTQSGLLIRFGVDTGVSRWFWLAQASEPGQWLAVRRAIHAHVHRNGVAAAPARAAPS